MKKIFLLKLLLAFSLLLVVSYGILRACGWSDWDEYGVSAFTPEAYVDSMYKPFFYSDQFYYEISYDNSHVYRFNDQITSEWKTYLGKPAADTEVRYLLLTASQKGVDSILRLPAASLPGSLAAFQLVKDKGSPKAGAFLKFLVYAKACEDYAATGFNYWDYEEKQQFKPLTAEQVSDRKAMEKEMARAPDKFLAQRYFFQVVRAYFFAADFATCIAFYEQHKADFPDNLMAARTMSYIAGCYYKQKEYAKANYLYSRVYDVGSLFMTVAHYSFHPQEEADWKQTLALCRDKKEQITLWHLLGIYFDEARAIREIYALDPQSEKLDLLLARLVNLQELKTNNGPAEYGYTEYRPAKDSLNQSALQLVSKIAQEGKTAKPYMWYLAAGYLHFINADYTKAAALYERAQKATPAQNELARAQVRLSRLMNQVAATKVLNAKSEAQLLPDLAWLQSIAAQQSLPAFRYAHGYAWIKMQLAGRYQKQGNVQRSELFAHTDTFYSVPQWTADMKAFLLKEQVTPFERYAKEVYDIHAEDINEYQALVLAYKDQLDEAIGYMAAAGAQKDVELLGNPFNGTIQDCHDCDHAAKQKVKYTKLSLLQKMKEMKANVLNGTEVYNNSLLLGNAYYNMSHYGNARYFFEGKIIGSGQSSPTAISSVFQTMLLNNKQAKAYYEKALSAAATEEQKAKLTYLLLKCERNEQYNKLYQLPGYDSWNYADIPPISFARLAPYSNTKYYNEIIEECGYFRNYLDKTK